MKDYGKYERKKRINHIKLKKTKRSIERLERRKLQKMQIKLNLYRIVQKNMTENKNKKAAERLSESEGCSSVKEG